MPTHRQNAAEYVALIENIEFFVASSCRIASVNKAVASTGCGRFPLSFQDPTFDKINQVSKKKESMNNMNIFPEIGLKIDNNIPSRKHWSAYLVHHMQVEGKTGSVQ